MSNSFKVFQDEKGDIFYLTEQYLEMIGIENKNNLKVGNCLIKDIFNNLFFKDYNDCVDFKDNNYKNVYLIFDCVIHSNYKIYEFMVIK